jgi:hypothetical protein
MKGAIEGKHIPQNSFVLSVVGLPDLTVVKMDGLEQELETIDLPDRTMASGGQTKTTEFKMSIPAHHDTEVNAMENWFRETKDPVSATYKKVGTLVQKDIEGTIRRTWSLPGLFPKKRAGDDLDMENEGDMTVIEWTMNTDDVIMTQ